MPSSAAFVACCWVSVGQMMPFSSPSRLHARDGQRLPRQEGHHGGRRPLPGVGGPGAPPTQHLHSRDIPTGGAGEKRKPLWFRPCVAFFWTSLRKPSWTTAPARLPDWVLVWGGEGMPDGSGDRTCDPTASAWGVQLAQAGHPPSFLSLSFVTFPACFCDWFIVSGVCPLGPGDQRWPSWHCSWMFLEKKLDGPSGLC